MVYPAIPHTRHKSKASFHENVSFWDFKSSLTWKILQKLFRNVHTNLDCACVCLLTEGLRGSIHNLINLIQLRKHQTLPSSLSLTIVRKLMKIFILRILNCCSAFQQYLTFSLWNTNDCSVLTNHRLESSLTQIKNNCSIFFPLTQKLPAPLYTEKVTRLTRIFLSLQVSHSSCILFILWDMSKTAPSFEAKKPFPKLTSSIWRWAPGTVLFLSLQTTCHGLGGRQTPALGNSHSSFSAKPPPKFLWVQHG